MEVVEFKIGDELLFYLYDIPLRIVTNHKNEIEDIIHKYTFDFRTEENIKKIKKEILDLLLKDIRKEKLNKMEIKNRLEKAYVINNNIDFVKKDPIQIPHKFSRKEDIEVSAFLTSVLAFGKREIIIKKSEDFIKRMNNEPYKYLMNEDYSSMKGFVHRTINDSDFIYYLQSLNQIYKNGGLEKLFSNDIEKSLKDFWKIFFSLPHEKRAERHISNIENGSAAKRLNFFLRWMIRKDNVDFGIWKNIDKSNLFIPLDVHVGNISRELGLIKRKQNDWKSVVEITSHLKKMCPEDPIKYDLALFSLDL